MPIVNDLVPLDPDLLVRARKRIGFTQYDLAAHSGVSRSYLSEIETGSKRPRKYMAEKLAEALSVKVVDLVA